MIISQYLYTAVYMCSSDGLFDCSDILYMHKQIETSYLEGSTVYQWHFHTILNYFDECLI